MASLSINHPQRMPVTVIAGGGITGGRRGSPATVRQAGCHRFGLFPHRNSYDFSISGWWPTDAVEGLFSSEGANYRGGSMTRRVLPGGTASGGAATAPLLNRGRTATGRAGCSAGGAAGVAAAAAFPTFFSAGPRMASGWKASRRSSAPWSARRRRAPGPIRPTVQARAVTAGVWSAGRAADGRRFRRVRIGGIVALPCRARLTARPCAAAGPVILPGRGPRSGRSRRRRLELVSTTDRPPPAPMHR